VRNNGVSCRLQTLITALKDQSACRIATVPIYDSGNCSYITRNAARGWRRVALSSRDITRPRNTRASPPPSRWGSQSSARVPPERVPRRRFRRWKLAKSWRESYASAARRLDQGITYCTISQGLRRGVASEGLSRTIDAASFARKKPRRAPKRCGSSGRS